MSETGTGSPPRRRSHLGPVGWLLVAMIVGYLFVTAAFYWLFSAGSPSFMLVFAVYLVYAFALYFLYFWIAIYFVVELALWRHTRNRGHLLQCLGGLLILAPISWDIAATSAMNVEMMFSPVGIALVLLGIVSLGVGIAFAMFGYTHRAYHANDVDLYRNVVVRAGERIGLLTDGYSTRVFETRYEGFPSELVRARADEYAARFQRAGFLLFHEMDGTGLTLYPVAYTGVSGLRIATAFAHLYRLWRHPDRLTWVRVEWSGAVKVHISPQDYARIRRPVAHHVLCAGVADAVVGSLMAFANGDETAAVQGLLGPEAVRGREELRLAPPKAGAVEAVVVGIALVLLVAGSGAALYVNFAKVTPPGPSITDVHWDPVRPAAGQNITLYANLTQTGFYAGPLESFNAVVWAYYNDSLYGAKPMAQIQGNEYGARLGMFPEGTELTVQLYAVQMAGAANGYSASPGYVIDVGTVHRDVATGPSIENPTFRWDASGQGMFGVWINSTAPIDTALVLFAGSYTYTSGQGSGSGGLGPTGMNLTHSGSYYTLTVPAYAVGPPYASSGHTVLWYKFVVRDANWNVASTEFLTAEVTT